MLFLVIGSVTTVARPAPFSPSSWPLSEVRFSQLIHRQWLDKDGLPSSTINDLAQTSEGYLWIGTAAGLVRFDGQHFETFDRSNTEAFVESYDIRALEVDEQGQLWVGTAGGGLVRLRNGQFEAVSGPKGLERAHVRALHAANGRLWVGTVGAGIFVRKEGAYQSVSGLSAKRIVTSFAATPTGSVWLGTDRGLRCLQGDTVQTPSHPSALGKQFVLNISPGTDESFLANTRQGVFRFLGGGECQVTTVENVASVGAFDTWVDEDNTFWIGSDGRGLIRKKSDSLEALKATDGLGSNRVTTLFRGEEGSLWIGTEGGGLHQLRRGTFRTLAASDGLSMDMALTVYEDAEGVLWVGTEGGGLNRIEDGQVTDVYTEESGLPSNVILSVQEDANGHLWVGTYGGGVGRLVNGQFVRETSSIDIQSAFALHRGPSGTLWMGTDTGLVSFHPSEGFVHVSETRDLTNLDISTLHETQDGALWIGVFPHGMYRLRDGVLKRYGETDGLPRSTVMDIHMSDDGTLWLATNGSGMAVRQDSTFETFTVRDGLHSDKIMQILEDESGNLWLGSHDGIARLSRSQVAAYQRGNEPTLDPTLFDENDGLRADELNGGVQPAGVKGRDGMLWFPTVKGVAGIDPSNILHYDEAPTPVIEQFEVDGEAVAPTNKLQVSPDEKKIRLRFSAPTFIAPEQVTFRYRLDGYEREWKTTTDRSATYTTLQPGRYSFEVQARNADGEWSSSAATLTFRQQPSMYQHPLFWVVCGVGLLGLGVFVHRVRVRWHRRQQQQLEQLVEERTEELSQAKEEAEEARKKAEEMNRLKSAFLANMSHEIRTPLTSIIGLAEVIGDEPETAPKFARSIERSGRRLLRTFNSVLQLAQLRAGTATVEREWINLVSVLRDVLSEFHLKAEEKGISLQYEPSSPHIAAMLDRAAIERVVANLVSNAIKFTEEGRIVVTVSSADKVVRVHVADTGVGIDEAKVDDVFEEFYQESTGQGRKHQGSGLGLAITKHLVELMDGDIDVQSAEGEGTIFSVVLPRSPHFAEAVSESLQTEGRVGENREGETVEETIDRLVKRTELQVVSNGTGSSPRTECVQHCPKKAPHDHVTAGEEPGTLSPWPGAATN